MRQLSQMLGPEGYTCHIPETLNTEASGRARVLLTRSMKHGPGTMATGHKRQASSTKRIQVRDASVKPQAASFKPKATSRKLPDP